LEAIKAVVKSNRFTMGDKVRAYEKEFADFFGSKYAVMVNSGSSANLLAVAGLMYHPEFKLCSGDEVIVSAVSWSTTYFPLHQYGLKLRFVDVDRDTLNMTAEAVRDAITPNTRAVLAVNLLGNPCDLKSLKKLCDEKGLLLIEDNCESMGARLGGKQAGTFGICGTFSSFFSHHISTMEGGMITTDDKALYHTFVSMRSHGWVRDQPEDSHLKINADMFTQLFRFVLPGYNLRPLEMSGAIGTQQLKKLPNFIAKRRENAACFVVLCGDIPGIRIQAETGESSWFGFSLILEGMLSGTRASLVDLMKKSGIECRPIVAGNFLANPVIEHIEHSVSGPLDVAKDLDENGLFVGNHHYGLKAELATLKDVLHDFCGTS